MDQVLSSFIKLWIGLDNRKPHGLDYLLNDSSIQAVDNDYKSFLDLDKEEILDDSHKRPWTESSSQAIKEVRVCKEVVVVKEKWIKQYCSSHKILLVGEGDFSFSTSLAVAFGSASNMVATSLDSEGFLWTNYKRAMSNIQELKNRGCFVMHGVDATEMADYYFPRGMGFDRIIYNFPLAGFFKDESRESQLERNRKLIILFFMNAKKMISEKGEIHIAHKSCGFFLEWNLKSLAGIVGLRLINELPFDFKDFRGYCTKYGFGGDNNFNCNPSIRYIFGL